MESAHSPNDNELSALIVNEQQHREVEQEKKIKARIVDEILWQAIDKLTVEPVVSRDPSRHEADYTTLLAEVREMLRVFPPDDTFEDLESKTIRIAEGIWNEELLVLARITHYITEQNFPTSPNVDHSILKRQLMSQLIAEGVHDDRWMDLIDAVLDGPALDTTKTEDVDLITEQLEWYANLESMPSVQLCNAITAILNIPKTLDEIDGSISIERINELINVTQRIAPLTLRMPGDHNQPNRHEIIHQIAREHSLDAETTERLLRATDSYECNQNL